MFGLTAGPPACEIVIPVVALAVGPIRDPMKKMITAMKKISPMREVPFLIRVIGMLMPGNADRIGPYPSWMFALYLPIEYIVPPINRRSLITLAIPGYSKIPYNNDVFWAQQILE